MMLDKFTGASELHWALEFLKSIRPSGGDCPKKVKVCINAMEDKLIELYAKMSNTSDGTIVNHCGVPSSASLVLNNGEYI